MLEAWKSAKIYQNPIISVTSIMLNGASSVSYSNIMIYINFARHHRLEISVPLHIPLVQMKHQSFLSSIIGASISNSISNTNWLDQKNKFEISFWRHWHLEMTMKFTLRRHLSHQNQLDMRNRKHEGYVKHDIFIKVFALQPINCIINKNSGKI